MSRPPWFASPLPWLSPASAELCRQAQVSPAEVRVVELPATPCTAADLVALRAGRYVPVFGGGGTRADLGRAVALVGFAFGAQADPRAPEHAATLLVHPALGPEPLRFVADEANEGRSPAWACTLILGLAGALGVADGLREEVAQAFGALPSLASEVALATYAGGGDRTTWREHYQRLRAADHADPPVRAVHAARHWFDFVLARRWCGLDGLRALSGVEALDAPSRWLAAVAEWLSGDESARPRMTDLAQGVLDPLRRAAPRLVPAVAREMAALVAHPWSLRWDHLRCAASRDHAAASIRAWLHAAAEERFFEEPGAELAAGEFGELGPEPSRAGRAAAEARQLAGDFLLDWYVPEHEARAAVDDWAWRALRVYHRLRGATLVEIALRGARDEGFDLDDQGRLVAREPGQ